MAMMLLRPEHNVFVRKCFETVQKFRRIPPTFLPFLECTVRLMVGKRLFVCGHTPFEFLSSLFGKRTSLLHWIQEPRDKFWQDWIEWGVFLDCCLCFVTPRIDRNVLD